MDYQLNSSIGVSTFILFILTITACSVDDIDDITTSDITESPEVIEVIEEVTFPLVDRELWSHFESFEEEALKRGHSFDLNALEITGVIEEIEEDGVAGTCQYGRHIHHVTVDLQFWRAASPLTRELVVYHELGHCVLFRDHTEEFNERGVCLSMMNSGTAPCRVAYTGQNRDFYIEELFSTIE